MLALRIIIYIFITGFLFYAAAVFTCKKLRPDSLLDEIIATSVVAISQQVLSGWVLGLLGHLFVVEHFILNVIISSALIILSRPSGKDWTAPFRIVTRAIRGLRAHLRRFDVRLFFLVDAVFVLFMFARGIIYPPYSWDGIYYHLTEVGFMLQDGGIGSLPIYPVEAFPRNIELTYLWHLIYPRHQLFINCIQIFYMFLAMFAIAGILKKAGCRSESAAFGALMFPVTPLVLQQSTTLLIDIAIAACFLSGINFLLSPKMKLSDFLLAGLAFGIVLGGKGTGFFLILAVAIPWIIFRAYGLIKRNGFARYAGFLAILLLAILINGVWIYARNWAAYGNPVRPYHVVIAGKTIFPGERSFQSHVAPDLLNWVYTKLKDKSWLGKLYYTWSEPVEGISYDGRLGGFGPIYFILLLPAMLASWITALLLRRWKYLLVALMFALALLAIHPMAWWSRYSVFFVAAGILGYAFMDGIGFKSDFRKAARYIAIALAVISFFCYFRITNLDLARLDHYLTKGPRYWHPTQYMAQGWQRGFFQQVYEYLQPGTTIMFDNSFENFLVAPLWNLDFSNRSVFALTDDKAEWFRVLDESHADYVIVGKRGKSVAWTYENPGRFDPLEQSDTFIFYRVKPVPSVNDGD